MQLLTLFRLLRALVLLVREIWLRERTFRQFVHQNLSLIMVWVGFVVMTGLFFNVFFIARAQETQLVEYRAENDAMGRQVDSLTSDLAWYRSMAVRRGLDPLTSPTPDIERPPDIQTSPATLLPQPPPAASETPLPPPRVPTPTDKPIVPRIPNNDLVDRWKRLTR